MRATTHHAEAQRLAALRDYEILDTPPEADFDEIVRVASAICNTPISLISLVDMDRQWFKAGVGLDASETDLDSSICAHAILQPDVLVVPDARADARFRDNPVVAGDPHIRFYAGAVLETADGLPLGTLCVIDYKPRELDENQLALLRLLSRQVVKLLEFRRINKKEREARLSAEAAVAENKMLAREGDHRVMNSLQLVSAVLSLQARSAGNAEVRSQLEDARNRVNAIATVHRQLNLTESLDQIDIAVFLQRLCGSLRDNAPAAVSAINVEADSVHFRADLASTIGLVVAELVTNAFKYAYVERAPGTIDVSFRRNESGWALEVSDAGVGLPADFDIGAAKGVGMRVITALVGRLSARLGVTSGPPRTTFTVTCDRQPEA